MKKVSPEVALRMLVDAKIVEQICVVAYEASRALCPNRWDEKPWDIAMSEIRQWYAASVRRVIGAPEMTAQQIHEAWVKQANQAGWKHGSELDGNAKTHPQLVPFGQLPRLQQLQYEIFRGIVGAFREFKPVSS